MTFTVRPLAMLALFFAASAAQAEPVLRALGLLRRRRGPRSRSWPTTTAMFRPRSSSSPLIRRSTRRSPSCGPSTNWMS